MDELFLLHEKFGKHDKYLCKCGKIEEMQDEEGYRKVYRMAIKRYKTAKDLGELIAINKDNKNALYGLLSFYDLDLIPKDIAIEMLSYPFCLNIMLKKNSISKIMLLKDKFNNFEKGLIEEKLLRGMNKKDITAYLMKNSPIFTELIWEFPFELYPKYYKKWRKVRIYIPIYSKDYIRKIIFLYEKDKLKFKDAYIDPAAYKELFDLKYYDLCCLIHRAKFIEYIKRKEILKEG